MGLSGKLDDAAPLRVFRSVTKYLSFGSSAGAPNGYRLRPYLPWAALAALCVLFELPTMMRPDRVDPLAMRPTGEVVLLLTAYAACRITRARAIFYRVLLALTILL